jgi:hypothetical protein
MDAFNDIDYLGDFEIEQPGAVLQLFNSEGELIDTYVGYNKIEALVMSTEWKERKSKYEAESDKNKESSEEIF